jgi:hypothetical protein
MKRIIFVLVLLLGAQTYGVYGATQARRIGVDCRLELGVLCFDWEQNQLGRILGEDGASELEASIESLEQAWEREVLQRAQDDEGQWQGLLDKLESWGREGLERAQRATEDL